MAASRSALEDSSAENSRSWFPLLMVWRARTGATQWKKAQYQATQQCGPERSTRSERAVQHLRLQRLGRMRITLRAVAGQFSFQPPAIHSPTALPAPRQAALWANPQAVRTPEASRVSSQQQAPSRNGCRDTPGLSCHAVIEQFSDHGEAVNRAQRCCSNAPHRFLGPVSGS
ncbi:hypothetical protein NDU88_000755 [Pleurodeles waltl]|uniref:Uncharacterized protein n=1 Tax=Pleurodeles waltl TaxID=8319 RepID=A0AAV7LDY6_PLEWA|nr:hypothetical protein NDU88_000755 [Pleurodeles waltl]